MLKKSIGAFLVKIMQINELLKIIHDASIIGIYSEINNQLILKVKTDQNRKLKIEFSNVEFFRFTDFCSQNIISRMIFSNQNVFSEQKFMKYLEWGN